MNNNQNICLLGKNVDKLKGVRLHALQIRDNARKYCERDVKASKSSNY